MKTPTINRPSDSGLQALAAIRHDLEQILTGILWAHTNGYWPATPTDTPNRPRNPNDDTRPDPVSRHDIGIGHHPSRLALHALGPDLAAAEVALAAAAYIAGIHYQPVIQPPGLQATIPQMVACTNRNLWRAKHLAIKGTPTHNRRHWRQAIHKASIVLYRAAGNLSRALDAGPATTDPTVTARTCVVCLVRPRSLKKGKRCDVCHQWWYRNGTERPRTIDQKAGGLAAVRMAAQRRRSRGEGWGAA